jgi:hypothetical protein
LVKAEVDRVPESQKVLERRAFREVDLDNIYLRCNTDVLTSDSSPTAIAPIIVDNVLQTFAGSGIEAPASLQQNLQQNYDPRGITLSCSKDKGSFKCWCIISSAALPRNGVRPSGIVQIFIPSEFSSTRNRPGLRQAAQD